MSTKLERVSVLIGLGSDLFSLSPILTAEYMLEIVSGERGRGIDFGDVWEKSQERVAIRKQIDELVESRKSRPDNTDSRADSEFSASLVTQISEVTKRQLRDTWRDAPFAYGILFSNFVTGIAA